MIVYAGSQFNLNRCLFGEKFVLQIPQCHAILFHQQLFHSGAKGIPDEKGYRLFAYEVHDEATANGPVMIVDKKTREDYVYNAIVCDVCKVCKNQKRDAWVVEIPICQPYQVIGSLSIQGFLIFKLHFGVEDVLTSVKEYLN